MDTVANDRCASAWLRSPAGPPVVILTIALLGYSFLCDTRAASKRNIMQQLSDLEIATFRRLADEAACRSLIERYTYAVDWMNWTGLEALFWPDAFLDFGMWQGNRADFIPWVTQLEETYRRRLHMFSAPRIEVTGELARIETGVLMFLR